MTPPPACVGVGEQAVEANVKVVVASRGLELGHDAIGGGVSAHPATSCII